ncbi:hypothetical protein niasHT_016971 [Heterodera trifolii]|uniref:Histone PARylation factor 1 n=1 Tax=Heterodera trifolii TaxID=157864 RepID=A0ABD2LAN4_9BILA
MATKKRQQKLPEEKQIGRKKPRNLEKENVETKIDDDETLLKRLDNVFMVKHPPELLNFWRHAVKLNPKKPLDAFSELDSLTLVGPFLLLAAAHSERHTKNTKNGATATADEDAQQQNDLLLGSRFATDLPEMETLLVHRGGRFCYWRDVPEEMPNFLVHVAAGGGEGHDHQHFPTMTICGERDLFAALQFVLNKLADTGTATTAKAKKQQSNNTGTTTTSNSGKDRSVKSEQKVEHLFPDNFDMSIYGPDYLQMLKKRRAKESLGMPFHGIGIKVPVNNKGIGYRPLSDDAKENAQLKRNIETMGTTDNEEKKAELKEKFYQMYSWVQFANDEMDFGMGLEFGHDLFMSNYACFDGMAKSVLMTSYELLGRKQFATLLEKHMEVRRHEKTV